MCTKSTEIDSCRSRRQWLKCHRTQENSVPLPPIFSPRRSLASNFQMMQEPLRGTLRYARKHISLNICAFLPFLRLRIHVKDVNVDTWLPDNEVNLVVSGPATTNRSTMIQKPSSIRSYQQGAKTWNYSSPTSGFPLQSLREGKRRTHPLHQPNATSHRYSMWRLHNG